MHVLIVTNHFWPENFRINDLAVGLRDGGHKVTVFTGVPDYPEGRFYAGYGIFRRRFESYKGVRVARFPLIPRGRGRSWVLVLNYLSSAFFSCLLAPFYCRERYDLILIFDTSPITIGLSALVIKKLRSIPVVLWILDLWPESLSATGAIRSPFIIGQVRKIVRFIYRRCDRILISSPGFRQNIKETGGYNGAVDYFPNWVEPEYRNPSAGATPHSLPLLPDGFRVMFAGNIGAAQDFETILAAAEYLRGHEEIHWIILGDGRRSDWVKTEVAERGLEKQFHLLGRFPAETMPAFFAQADAMLLTLKDEPIFALTIPGKLQSYMASGKPIIACLNGEGANLVNESQAGFSCPAESPELLAEAVLKMSRLQPEQRLQLGRNGQSYCATHFNREKLFGFLEEVILGLSRNPADKKNV